MSYDTIKPAVGASLAVGKAYHDIPGVTGSTYRSGSQLRANQIADHIQVAGKTGLDLGCSVGGVSFGLMNHGASKMVGVDHDETAIAVATKHNEDNDLGLLFKVVDLTEDHMWRALMTIQFDFAIWLANWMWVAKAAGVETAKRRLRELSEAVPALAFETAQGVGGSMAGTFGMHTNDDVLDLLATNTTYTDIRCVGPVADGWHRRSLFIARRDA